MLDQVDGPALEALCMNVGIMREAAAELKHAPALVPGSHGNVKRNPLYDVFQAAQSEVRTWCERFGLDPATRTRLGMAELQRRSLAQEMSARLGEPRLRKVK
jgi:P27 family predicted phage terminase small subunit